MVFVLNLIGFVLFTYLFIIYFYEIKECIHIKPSFFPTSIVCRESREKENKIIQIKEYVRKSSLYFGPTNFIVNEYVGI